MTPTLQADAEQLMRRICTGEMPHRKVRDELSEALQSAFNAGCEAMREKIIYLINVRGDAFDWAQEHISPSKEDFISDTLLGEALHEIRNLPTPPYGEKK
jgi:hypothetical protein